jgi:catechol 2,3-dioxygenase-like lactoylglutathione lyase family enzyme
MISGAHVIIYSVDAEADRVFFRDVLGFPSVDAGQGWLIFALPPAEIAFHPAAENGKHEIYLMCDDVAATIQTLERQKVKCDPVADLGWGLLTHVSLPGGGRLGLYQPKHQRAARKDGTKLLP